MKQWTLWGTDQIVNEHVEILVAVMFCSFSHLHVGGLVCTPAYQDSDLGSISGVAEMFFPTSYTTRKQQRNIFFIDKAIHKKITAMTFKQ